MINIEGNSNIGAGIGLLQNIPKGILNKVSSKLFINKGEGEVIEVVIISSEYPEVLRKEILAIGGKYEDLGYGFGIVQIGLLDVIKLAQIPAIQYIELPKNLYTTDTESNRASCVQQAQSLYNSYGEGVVVGFIDSGIDYTHRAFRNDDGTTRIKFIYDLSGDGEIYNSEKINEALKSKDPYSVVNSQDLTKHGTHVAGIACAGGKIDPKYYGVAPRSSIIMVKATRGAYTLSTQIMRGLKFLVAKSKELGMPIVINISLSTNDGAHNGTSLLEKYIQTICNLERVTIVIAAGNEGDAAHHIGGELNGKKDIFINIGADEQTVIINLYKSILPELSCSITSPTGATSQQFDVTEGYIDGAIGNDRYQVYITGPKPFDINGEIIISLISLRGYLVEGRWKISISVKDEYIGRFDMWLPISEGLNKSTKFFEPTVLNTLGIPATVENVISVGSYNYQTNNLSSFSGRGVPSIYIPMKPDLVAPGEGIYSTIPINSYDRKSGTSMASPHVTGVCALLLEWGLVKGNDPYLYGERLKFFLVNGAKRTRTDIEYPNPSWGYGTVCALGSFDFLSSTINSLIRGDNMKRLEPIDEMKYGVEDALANSVYAGSGEIVSLIVEFKNIDEMRKFMDISDVEVIPIDNRFTFVNTPYNKISEIYPYASQIIPIQVPDIYTLNAISPVEASGSLTLHNSKYLDLNGTDVLVGIIDTGIDYLNNEFMKEDDTTRIVSIWDQTIKSEEMVYDTKIGQQFSEEQINNAIQAKQKNEDPYLIVPSKDTNGHGTMVAGLVGARGYNPELVGAAPDCKFVIVKLRQATDLFKTYSGISVDKECYDAVSIVLGLRYILRKAAESKRPVVIYIPLSSNIGPHDGTSLIESFIDSVSSRVGVAIVTGVGNQGDTDTHTEGRIDKTGDTKVIELKVGEKQKNINFQIWARQPDKVAISIISPSGEVIEKIPPRLKKSEDIKFVLEGTTMQISYQIPEIITGDEVINIRIRNLRPGIWQFILIGDYIVDGRYWSWIPQRQLLDDDTRFLSPSQYTTLTIPSTSRDGIVAAYYNQDNSATVGRSGRGYTRDDRVKPDIAVGGIGAKIILPGGGIGTASGSSVGGAVLSGCVAQIMEWGIVLGNDPQLYSTKIRAYLIRGAKTRAGEKYPNREWGYGMLDMEGVFNKIRGNNVEYVTKYSEYMVGNLFIRIPK